MREYLIREADEGWIIDLTPEGQTPDVPTRIFPGVRQPLAIGVFVRTPENSKDVPALLRYLAVTGRQADKFKALSNINLTEGWESARTEWTAPFTPEAALWDSWPASGDLLAWHSPGVKSNRNWAYAASRSVLASRWNNLREARGGDRFAELFKNTQTPQSTRLGSRSVVVKPHNIPSRCRERWETSQFA